MNQGKLEVVKNETECIELELLGINELKWTGIGHCESDEYIVYYAEAKNIKQIVLRS